MRESLSFYDTVMDILVQMAEGNPGACTVLAEMIKRDPVVGVMAVIHMDDMNIRGAQIWVAYKNFYCGGKGPTFEPSQVDAFIAKVIDRDSEMVRVVNEQSGLLEKAVTEGASLARDKQ